MQVSVLEKREMDVWNAETQQNEKKEVVNLQAWPVSGGSEENKRFFAASPGGMFSIYSANLTAFEGAAVGKSIYIDVTVAAD